MRKAATQGWPNRSNTTIGAPGFRPEARPWQDSPSSSHALPPRFARSMLTVFANTASATATSWTPLKSLPISITSTAWPTRWASIPNPKCASHPDANRDSCGSRFRRGLLLRRRLITSRNGTESDRHPVPAIDCHDGDGQVYEFLFAELLARFFVDFIRRVA